MQKWTIGALTIHSVLETLVPTRPDRLFRGLPSELPSWLHPHYVDDAGNLLVAGRCASMNAAAQSAARVSGACFVMGEAAGLGAALALRSGRAPADIDVAALQRGLQSQGAWLGRDAE